MGDFRIALISIGIFAILGILAHGIWTIRKNKKVQEIDNAEYGSSDRSSHGFETQEPEIVISDDDPLLRSEPTLNKDSSSKDDASSGYRPFSEYSEDESKAVSPKEHVDTAEVDPLVGDVPLYDNSDLAFNKKTSSPAKGAAGNAPHSLEHEDFDDDGIGSVRVVSEAPISRPEISEKVPQELPVEEVEELPEPPSSLLRKDATLKKEDSAERKSIDEMPMIDTSIDIDDSPKNDRRSGALKSEHTRTEVVGGNRLGRKAESITEKAKKLVGLGQEESEPTKSPQSKKSAASSKSKKTKADPNKDQIRLDLESEPEANNAQAAQANDLDQGSDSEVLILNVRVPEGKVIQGAALLPSLLTLGFKFGEHNMFHRHAASNGKGPRLFTLANMFNPGTFDIDNMENFNTTGVSLFMTLPIDADAHQVFNMMHNAARKLADEFDAQVLDGRRSVLTRQSLQQYVEKIREFERRRMIRR